MANEAAWRHTVLFLTLGNQQALTGTVLPCDIPQEEALSKDKAFETGKVLACCWTVPLRCDRLSLDLGKKRV